MRTIPKVSGKSTGESLALRLVLLRIGQLHRLLPDPRPLTGPQVPFQNLLVAVSARLRENLRPGLTTFSKPVLRLVKASCPSLRRIAFPRSALPEGLSAFPLRGDGQEQNPVSACFRQDPAEPEP